MVFIFSACQQNKTPLTFKITLEIDSKKKKIAETRMWHVYFGFGINVESTL